MMFPRSVLSPPFLSVRPSRAIPVLRLVLGLILLVAIGRGVLFGVVPADGSAAWQSDNGDGTYTNPVLYADYPDPDIIRVGRDFYMVSTTFVNSPGINLLHSKDLVNWSLVAQVASIVDGGDRYDLKGGTAYEGGYWACSLRYHKGTFYVAVQPNFAPGRIYYASDPAGPWQYHQLDRGIYDPGLFIDDDGRGYIVCGHSPQSLMILSPDFSRIVEQRDNYLDSGAEGCHVVKRGRHYYVFTAKPAVWPFQLLCWRTTDLLNPRWEKRVALTATTGGHQGGIVTIDDNDNWFGFVHQDSGPIGRMPRIGPVFWENNWPVFGTRTERDVMPATGRKPVAGQPLRQVAASDDFSAAKLGLQWAWNHNPDNTRWSLTERPGFLRLRPSKADGFWTARNTLTQKTQGPKSHAHVKLDLSNLRPGDVAGFGVHGKISAYAAVSVNAKGEKILGSQVLKHRIGDFAFHPEKTLPGDTLHLRVDLDYESAIGRCSYSLDGREWTPIGGPFDLMFGYGSTFQGPQFAIFCYNTETDTSRGFLDVDSYTFGGGAPLASLVRGRPRLNAGRTTFVADNGQLLRGPYQSTEWSDPPPFNEVAAMKRLGFNAVHLYAECFDPAYPAPGSTAPGYAAAKIDEVVEMTRKLGLYLVITIGNGAHNGKYNRQWVVDFWKHYAPRYAAETHVLYEIQNEPVAWGPPYSNPEATPPGAVDMEIEAYKTIRAHAPRTPVLLFTYAVLAGEAAAEKTIEDIKAFNAGVGGDPRDIWSNTAVGFHGYAGHDETPAAVARLLREGYPCFMTEFISHTWGGPEGLDVELTAELERLGVSWLNFLTIPPDGVSPLVTLADVYKDRVNHSGLSWVPDYGDWPAARGAYGNGGLPRATPDTRERDILKGKLRLEIEDFDTGGQDRAYRDATPHANEDGAYRPDEKVDIRRITDDGPGHAVTRTADGEWLEYTLFVREPGHHRIALRYAAERDGSSVRLLFGGREKLPETALERTGGANVWKTHTASLFLEYGRQIMRLEIPKGGCELNWLEISPEPEGPVPDGEYQIVNRHDGLAMVNNTTSNAVEPGPPSAAGDRTWKLQHLGAGQYRISSLENNRFWSVEAATGKPVGLVWWGGENPGRHQRYVIRATGDGYYRIAPVAVGLDLSAGAGTILQQLYTGATSQQWAIQRAGATPIPTGVMAVRTSEKDVRVSWNPAPGATGYHVKRAEVAGGPYRATPQPQRETTFTDWSAVKGRDYFYVVSAVGPGGESLNSAEVSPAVLHAHLTFDETQGAALGDAAGNGWAGTLVGGPRRVPGKIGGALALEGHDSHVTLPEGIVAGLGDFSITGWVKLDEALPWARLFDFGTGTDTYMFLVPVDGFGARVRFVIRKDAGEQFIASSKPAPVGEWAHLAVTVGKGVGILYLNGEEVGRNAGLSLTPRDLGRTTRNYLGKSQFHDPMLKGAVDDFRIYGSVLSPIEIRALAGAQPAR